MLHVMSIGLALTLRMHAAAAPLPPPIVPAVPAVTVQAGGSGGDSTIPVTAPPSVPVISPDPPIAVTGTDCVISVTEVQNGVTAVVTFGGSCDEANAIAAANPGTTVQHIPDSAVTDQATLNADGA